MGVSASPFYLTSLSKPEFALAWSFASASAGPAVAVVGVACAASQACAAVGDRELPVKHLPRVVTVHSLQLI